PAARGTAPGWPAPRRSRTPAPVVACRGPSRRRRRAAAASWEPPSRLAGHVHGSPPPRHRQAPTRDTHGDGTDAGARVRMRMRRARVRAPGHDGSRMLLMIDNYDSFTFNLVQYLQELGAEVRVERNDALTVDEIERLAPQRIVVSPGPCTPNEAGVSMAVIERLGPTTP